jgi:hypothetical protein
VLDKLSWHKGSKGEKRIILVSSVGVDRCDQFPYKILNSYGVLDQKRRSEELLLSRAKERGNDTVFAIEFHVVSDLFRVYWHCMPSWTSNRGAIHKLRPCEAPPIGPRGEQRHNRGPARCPQWGPSKTRCRRIYRTDHYF